MPDFKPRPYQSDADQEANLLEFKRHIEDIDFARWIPARSFNSASGATEGVYAGGPYWDLANAANQDIVATHNVPTYWNVGKILMRVYYTGTASSTANFNVTLRISVFDRGGTALTTAAGDGTGTQTVNLPGPATADELVAYTMTSAGWYSKTTADDLIAVTVLRNGNAGGDANTGSMRILGVLLQFYPTRR